MSFAEALPELADRDWMHHASAFSNTGFWSVARRLPAIVREAVAVGWQASKRDTLAALGLNLVAGVMTTLGLLATSNVLAKLFAAGPTPDRVRAALPALAVAALAVMAKGGLTIAAGWAQARLLPRISYHVELKLFEATTSVQLSAYDSSGFAEDMDRARDRGMREAASIVDGTVNLTTGVVGVLATAVAVALIEPILLPCLVLASLPAAVTAVRMARREYLAMLARINRRRRMWMLARLMANRYTASEIRSYQMRGFLLEEYRRMMGLETVAQLRLVRSQTATRLAGMSVAGLALGGLYLVLGMLLLDGSIPLAAAATALLAVQTARSGLNTAIFATNSLYEDALYYSDYRDFLARCQEYVRPATGKAVDGFEKITVDNVTLRYPETQRAAVDGVSLSFSRGEVIALVGENGSGKSTLAKLLAGLYEPTSGVIAWDGMDVSEIDADSLASQIAVVNQDWQRFPFTAGRNVSLGRHDRAADQDSIVRAATAATAHEMVMALPKEYDTLLDREFKDGHEISSGQWQRLVAARGFYRDAALLICDEPSASLDARAENAIFQQLRGRPDRTVVLITHRLANVRHADRIFVLEKGRLAEQGTHDELMSRPEGVYRSLFDLQAAGYRHAG
ncbi:ABC transporter ATP-binding protein [Catelliglobosispora koreensis]|uniref:ABC transporter ATP-binding protein n=1 Tax=Catelliglobosispora koreensis TaxID=129052 RepID=UPI00036519D3|nr:ABC transporter ATP-binding protein [Catelliglobosispora koreensis]